MATTKLGYSVRPPVWMNTVDDWPGPMTGAAASEYCDCYELAKEVFGEPDGNSGLLAMAYLFRRFGPPTFGSDDHKEICRYHLHTEAPDVFLGIAPRGSGPGYGYMVTRDVESRIYRRFTNWESAFQKFLEDDTVVYKDPWKARMDPSVVARAEKVIGKCPKRIRESEWRKSSRVVDMVHSALLGAMRELLRPVYCRDVPFNILGRVKDVVGQPAPVFRHAGIGCQVIREAMEDAPQ